MAGLLRAGGVPARERCGPDGGAARTAARAWSRPGRAAGGGRRDKAPDQHAINVQDYRCVKD